jgi:hypothetical protein
LNDSAAFANYTGNLIQYETDPGGENEGWPTRTLFFSSDQMRDSDTVGQHGLISRAFPNHFTIDTLLAVEQQFGGDIAPVNAAAPQLTRDQSLAAGIVQVLAHGRTDGFVVRSEGYNTGARSYLLTLPEHSSHGSFDTAFDATAPPFYYSLACDNGGFDRRDDQHSVVEHLLGGKGGAVGMVAYSRWGWVHTSHLLQRVFFESLFANPDEPAVKAMYESKAVYTVYRDLVLGQNFFGDPALRVWTTIPSRLTMTATFDDASATIQVLRDGDPVVALIRLCDSTGALVTERWSDAQGELTVSGLSPLESYTAVATSDGCTAARTVLVGQLVTDVPEDRLELPGDFRLYQNYPNPFNPTTTISFDLPSKDLVRIDVFNSVGQKVSALLNKELPAGHHSIEWKAVDSEGREVASGVYFYRITAGQTVSSRKMILVR